MTAEDFTNLHLQYLSTQAEGELPATIEHDFHNGRMVDHYFVTPSPNFWQDEAIKALEGVTGIMFLQQRTVPPGRFWSTIPPCSRRSTSISPKKSSAGCLPTAMSFFPANRALSRLCRRKPNYLRATAKRVPAQGRHLAVALFITAYCLSVFLSETQKRDRKIGIPVKATPHNSRLTA